MHLHQKRFYFIFNKFKNFCNWFKVFFKYEWYFPTWIFPYLFPKVIFLRSDKSKMFNKKSFSWIRRFVRSENLIILTSCLKNVHIYTISRKTISKKISVWVIYPSLSVTTFFVKHSKKYAPHSFILNAMHSKHRMQQTFNI